MKIILYTSPKEIVNEIEIISQLFEIGVDYLYIRKPELDDFSLVDFVEKIPEPYWKKCISTSMIITKEFNLGGYHFTRDILIKNEKYHTKVLEWLYQHQKISSASAHSINELERLNGHFKHLIVSPIFPSISKENHSYPWNYSKLNDCLNSSSTQPKSLCFAVGGIDINKIEMIKNTNFDGIGLLGAIWNHPEKAKLNFQKIKESINNIES